MARNILKLNDPERIAINNRLGKTIRWLGEHAIGKDMLISLYGEDNPVLALIDDDPDKEVTLIEAISLAVFNRAMKGDVRALEFIRDTMGEKPAQNINVKTEGATTLSALTTEALARLAELNNKADVVQADKVVEVDSEPTDCTKDDENEVDNPFDEVENNG
ncbi:hypothetical protein EOM57_04355 [Candidatus Saccharibacteria bacterium]|nr:hypothetical protein [Candidatus Saccharibacteria bacterium]